MRLIATVVLFAVLGFCPALTHAQSFAQEEPVLQQIWDEGHDRSEVERLMQVLLDSLGPRLTGTPQKEAAHDWAVTQYERWGVSARNQQYGTWTGWERGITHVDLLEPRVRSLDGMILGWSPGTDGPVEGPVLAPPAPGVAFDAWLREVDGAFVLLSFPQPSCRPDGNWLEHGGDELLERMRAERSQMQEAWNARLMAGGQSVRGLARILEDAGAAGILTSQWSGWGAERIFGTYTETVPTIGLSCEDYGLVARLADNGQGPRMRVNAEARFLGDVPTFNTIAEIRGTELPNEYVVLSAHFDSWDGGSGATDNGTGTVTMMEAMRILREIYPNPRRTILVGHWGGEEQGLNGSRAFTEDNPHVVEGLQALFNQDNGTGRIVRIPMSGFVNAGEHFARWFTRMPTELTADVDIDYPGYPAAGGTDHASFVCHGAPGFSLSSAPWDYFTYTWHTNIDTYDKVVLENVRLNAVMTAMLAYLASEDPERIGRTQRTVFPDAGTRWRPAGWPECRPAQRTAP